MITWKQEENELADERFVLTKERICNILTEESVNEPYLGYFRETAKFLLELTKNRDKRRSGYINDRLEAGK